MQFLSISKRVPGLPEREFVRLTEAEAARALTLQSEGFLRQIWHRADTPGACQIWEAESEPQVRELLNSYPFVQAGLIEVELIPLSPYAWSRTFSRMIEPVSKKPFDSGNGT